ncbi:MAG: sugar-binding protein, partial [Candidatus Brocadiia bacterium]
MTGLVAHPQDPDIIYMRTDVGGFYRLEWPNAQHPDHPEWINISMKWVGYDEQDLYGIDGIALDPNDTQTVWVACGAYEWTNYGGVFKSTDGGETWNRMLTKVFIGNGNYRWLGECIAVAPGDSNRVLVGTRYDGMWKTDDGGQNWYQVSGIPTDANGAGVRSVFFHPNDSSVAYATVVGDGVYQSTDGGNNWARLSGSPANPARLQVSGDGVMYVTADQGVFRYDGAFTDVSPSAAAFNGLAVDPNDSNHVVASETGGTYELPVYRTLDGGSTWENVNNRSTYTNNVPWYPDYWKQAATSCLLMRPANTSEVWFGDWYQAWRAQDLDASTVHWESQPWGHEELCVFDLATPCAPSEVHLLNGCADNGGLRHTDVTQYPTVKFGNQESTGLDFCEAYPDELVRVSSLGWGDSNFKIDVSSDGGLNWQDVYYPDTTGKVQMSSSDPGNIIYAPTGENVNLLYTQDGGSNWYTASGLPTATFNSWFWDNYNKPIASDRRSGGVFYCFIPDTLYASEDGGANWSARASGLPSGSGMPARTLKSSPFDDGELWLAISGEGLYRSQDYGYSFTRIDYFSDCILVGIGPPVDQEAIIYAYGSSTEHGWGIYRSQDHGSSWEFISDPDYKITCRPMQLLGDRHVAGRVYVGTNGTGVFYGEPGDTTPPAAPTGLSATAVGTDQIDLDWDDNTESDLDSYSVYRAASSGGPYSLVAGGVGASAYSDTGLAASTAYYYVATAVDTSFNESGYSNEATATTEGDTTPPAAPTGLAAAASDGQVDLNWDENAEGDLDRYEVYRSITSGSGYSPIASVYGSSNYLDASVTNGTTYYYVVTAVDTSDNESGYSNEASATPQAAAADATIVGAASAPTIDGSADSVWADANAYTIANSLSGESGGSDLGGTWSALWDSDNLYFLIEVTDETQVNDSADAWDDDSIELYLDGDNSKGTSYDGVNDFQWVFRWNDGTVHVGTNSVNDTTGIVFDMVSVTGGYNCEISIPWTTIGATPSEGLLIGTDVHVNDDDDGGARDGKMAWFATADSSWTDPSTFATAELGAVGEDTTPPAAPTNLSATAGDGSVSLDWDDNTEGDLASYSVYRSTTSGSGYSSVATGVSSSAYTDSGVTNGTTYYYVVTATDTSGNESGYSSEASATPTASTADATIAEAASAPTIDGSADAVWSSTNTYSIANALSGATGGSDLSGQWRALWDSTNLYYLVEITDEAQQNDSTNAWDDDSVELYIDADNSKGTSYDGVNDYQLVLRWNDATIHLGTNSATDTTGMDFAIADTADGYTVEVL